MSYLRRAREQATAVDASHAVGATRAYHVAPPDPNLLAVALMPETRRVRRDAWPCGSPARRGSQSRRDAAAAVSRPPPATPLPDSTLPLGRLRPGAYRLRVVAEEAG